MRRPFIVPVVGSLTCLMLLTSGTAQVQAADFPGAFGLTPSLFSEPPLLLAANKNNNSNNKKKQQQQDDDDSRRQQRSADTANNQGNEQADPTRQAIAELDAEIAQVTAQRNAAKSRLATARAERARLTRAYDSARQSLAVHQKLVDAYARRPNPSSRARNRAQLAQSRVTEQSAVVATLRAQLDTSRNAVETLKTQVRADRKKLHLMQAEGEVLRNELATSSTMVSAADESMQDAADDAMISAADDSMADALDAPADAQALTLSAATSPADVLNDKAAPAYLEIVANARSTLEKKRQALTAVIGTTGTNNYAQYALAAKLEAELAQLEADIDWVEGRGPELTDAQAVELAATLETGTNETDSAQSILRDYAMLGALKAHAEEGQVMMQDLLRQAEMLAARLTREQAAIGSPGGAAAAAATQKAYRETGQAIVTVEQELKTTDTLVDVWTQDINARVQQLRLTENAVPLNVDTSNDQVEFKFSLQSVGEVDTAITRLQTELTGIDKDLAATITTIARHRADLAQIRSQIDAVRAQSGDNRNALFLLNNSYLQVAAEHEAATDLQSRIAYTREINRTRTAELQLNRTALTGEVINGQPITLPQLDVLLATTRRQLAREQQAAARFEMENPGNAASETDEQSMLWQAVANTESRLLMLEETSRVVESETLLKGQNEMVVPRIPELILDSAEEAPDYRDEQAQVFAEIANVELDRAETLERRMQHGSDALEQLADRDSAEADQIEAGILNLSVQRKMHVDQAQAWTLAAQAVLDQPSLSPVVD